MKATFLLAALGLVLAGCQKNESAVSPAEDPDWIKLEIPTNISGDQAYSIAGNIDGTLLVTAAAQIYRSTDRGRTWQVSTNRGTIPGLLTRNDTVFALPSFYYNGQGRMITGYADDFTTDLGKTWLPTGVVPGGYDRYIRLRKEMGQANGGGTSYRTKENAKIISQTSTTTVSERLATDVLRTDATGQTKLRLPGQHYLNDLHLDAQNRLYVAASGLYFEAKTGAVVIDATTRNRAVVYVSRRPLP